MKASEIITQVTNLANYQSNQKNDSSNKTDTTKASDFQDLMNSNLRSNQDANRDTVTNTSVNTSNMTVPKVNQTTMDTSKSKSTEEKPLNTGKSKLVQNTKSQPTKTQTVKTKTVKTQAGKAQLSSAQEKSATGNEPIADKINDLNTHIKETVMESLQITEEQLERIMSTLGLDYLQLLEPSNIAQVFMEANQLTDPAQMLMNSQLSEQFNQLLDQVNQINLSDFNLTTEDVNSYLDNKLETFEEILTPTQETVTVHDPKVKHNEEKVNVTEQQSVLDGDASDKQIKVEVEKYIDQSTKDQSSSQQQSRQSQNNEQTDSAIQDTNLNTIINNLSKVSTIESFGDQLVQVEQVRDVVNQVVEQIKIVIKPEHTSMEMQLNPENLGKVNLVVAQKDGVLTAQFTVQNEMAKEALESQLQTLKDSFSQQGLKVDAVEITVSNQPFSQDNMSDGNKDQQKSSGRRKNINLSEIDMTDDDLTDDEELNINIMQQNGNSVDYSA